MPDRHRAAALRLAWARRQLAAGHSVWNTPAVHTWDAWLTRQWRDAVQRGAVPPARLLGASQERALWEGVLAGMAADGEDDAALAQHAGALMLAAARATQSAIDPARLALGREESLLSQALQAVRAQCRARGLLSLRLATADTLDFLAQVPAPLIVGERTPTALQTQLAERFWGGTPLVAPAPVPDERGPDRRVRAGDLEQELVACAQWCRAQVERNPAARLLVLSACIEPSLPVQGELLWRAIAGGTSHDATARARWLAVEGGEPLLHQALAAEALAALELAGAEELDTAMLLQLLRSPYVGFAADAPRQALSAWLADQGLGRWSRPALRDALRIASAGLPAAVALAAWLRAADDVLAGTDRADATEWARRFTLVLDAAGFARAALLDSREQQRLARWNELLDEFAGLDAVLPPSGLVAALSRLRRLGAQSRHQAATADVAVTLSGHLADPVVGYDGIWVLGLAESRWPAAPRPDPWIAIAAQRHAQWPESGVTQRRAQALWALQCWRARGSELVLSFAEREGDLVHRPAALIDGEEWEVTAASPPAAQTGLGHPAADQSLPPLDAAATASLKGGTSRLLTQQACPFRGQAQWRLAAQPPPMVSSGVPASLRGRLLHLVLQHLWDALRDQPALLRLDAAGQSRLVARCWDLAVAQMPAARWLSPQALQREGQRAADTLGKVLELERTRPHFTVEARELDVSWQGAGARVTLRIDRIDRVGDASVLIDYKSGAAARVALHEDLLQPLQLAIYAAALAQHDTPVDAATLLTLHPANPSFSGVTAQPGLLPKGPHAVEDWPRSLQHWQQQLLGLMAQHLSGDATLTIDRNMCQRCHLPALCRRAGADATADAGADAADLADAAESSDA